jgi:excisionase family DNA binding protein
MNELTRQKSQVERFLLTPREAAESMGICERTLYGLTKRGDLPVVRIGRAVRYSVDDIRAWIKKSKKFSESA